jgi:hypothetical protein
LKKTYRFLIRFLMIFLFLTPSQAAFSQTQPNQNWLLFEKGNAAFAGREFGLALQLYKEAILQAGTFPEAELAIGDIYAEEGETELAIVQYEKAYTLRKAFYIPTMQYDVLYKIAHLFEINSYYKRMEDKLLTVVLDDKRFSETTTSKLRTQVEKNFYEKGLDRVLALYSYEDTFSASAHSHLGWFYYRTGRYAQSVSQLLFSIIYRISAIDQFLLERDTDYHFTSLQDLFAATEKSSDLLRYLNDSALPQDLYYLAASTFALGYLERGTTIWKALSTSPAAGEYQILSQKQLKSPFSEPLLSTAR